MILSKEEVMKRYLRGDFDTLHKLGNNNYGNTSNIYWCMRDRGWGNHNGVIGKAFLKEGEMIYYTAEGSPSWYTDLNEVLKKLGYI